MKILSTLLDVELITGQRSASQESSVVAQCATDHHQPLGRNRESSGTNLSLYGTPDQIKACSDAPTNDQCFQIEYVGQ